MSVFLQNAAAMHCTELLKTSHIGVDLFTGSVQQTTSSTFSVSDSLHCLVIVCNGTLLMRRVVDHQWTVVAPQSIAYACGRCDISMSISRGSHKFYIVSWAKSANLALDAWITDRVANQRKQSSYRCPHSRPMLPNGASQLARVDQLLRSKSPQAIPSVLTLISDSVGIALSDESETGLSPLPEDLPTTIRNLTDRVKSRPDLPWPIKEAADLVGYSPFHFSRVFKGLVGYGFHEFVDRCRTEFAVKLLTRSDDPIDIIAASAGFGTAQSLRESVKEHLGLLPSELRGVNDDLTVS